MKRLIIILLLLSCNKDVKEDVYELPLRNRLTPTVGNTVQLACEVFTHTNINDITYAINTYSSNKVSVDYKILVSWMEDGKELIDTAKMPYLFTQWTTSTRRATINRHVTTFRIRGVICSDTTYKFIY